MYSFNYVLHDRSVDLLHRSFLSQSLFHLPFSVPSWSFHPSSVSLFWYWYHTYRCFAQGSFPSCFGSILRSSKIQTSVYTPLWVVFLPGFSGLSDISSFGSGREQMGRWMSGTGDCSWLVDKGCSSLPSSSGGIVSECGHGSTTPQLLLWSGQTALSLYHVALVLCQVIEFTDLSELLRAHAIRHFAFMVTFLCSHSMEKCLSYLSVALFGVFC